jgi:hypothetical protein
MAWLSWIRDKVTLYTSATLQLAYGNNRERGALAWSPASSSRRSMDNRALGPGQRQALGMPWHIGHPAVADGVASAEAL